MYIYFSESKLTRILGGSLGGGYKTSLIITVSPASSSLDETFNTLEYGHQARHIYNVPEIGRNVSKSPLVQLPEDRGAKVKFIF